MTATPAPAGPGLTRNQRLVLDTLMRSATPQSAYAILDALRPVGFRAPPQVYRALDKLIEAGLVHRIESMNAFVACCDPTDAAHETTVFMLCDQCGAVDEFADAPVARRLDRLARDRAFHADKRTVEIRGACRRCNGDSEGELRTPAPHRQRPDAAGGAAASPTERDGRTSVDGIDEA